MGQVVVLEADIAKAQQMADAEIVAEREKRMIQHENEMKRMAKEKLEGDRYRQLVILRGLILPYRFGSLSPDLGVALRQLPPEIDDTLLQSLNILFIGDTGAGKSALMGSFQHVFEGPELVHRAVDPHTAAGEGTIILKPVRFAAGALTFLDTRGFVRYNNAEFVELIKLTRGETRWNDVIVRVENQEVEPPSNEMLTMRTLSPHQLRRCAHSILLIFKGVTLVSLIGQVLYQKIFKNKFEPMRNYFRLNCLRVVVAVTGADEIPSETHAAIGAIVSCATGASAGSVFFLQNYNHPRTGDNKPPNVETEQTLLQMLYELIAGGENFLRWWFTCQRRQTIQ